MAAAANTSDGLSGEPSRATATRAPRKGAVEKTTASLAAPREARATMSSQIDTIAKASDSKQGDARPGERNGMPLQMGHGQHRQGSPEGLGGGDLKGVAQAEALGEVVVDAPGQAGQGDPQHALPLADAQRTR